MAVVAVTVSKERVMGQSEKGLEMCMTDHNGGEVNGGEMSTKPRTVCGAWINYKHA